MQDHVKFRMQPEGRTSTYEIDIFQSAFEELVFAVKNTSYYPGHSILFPVDVGVKAGFSWKLGKNKLYCDSGNAADLVKLFSNWEAFARRSVQELIFNNPKNNKRPGL